MPLNGQIIEKLNALLDAMVWILLVIADGLKALFGQSCGKFCLRGRSVLAVWVRGWVLEFSVSRSKLHGYTTESP